MSGGSGQVILGIAGAVIGGMIGGPFGASLGFTIGMTAGGIIWPMDGGTQYGPRLADREVQSSAYGVPIPVVWGSYRLAGNVIWCREGGVEERADFKRVGKSLFSSGTKVWSYTYYGHFAVAVCEGPISSIGRIWADGKLIHDPETVDGKYDKYIVKYLGTEDQLPHPTIQADKGIANTPAFRGTAYVVFEGLPLLDFGNRIPTMSIEVGALPIPDKWLDGSVTNLGSSNWTYTPLVPDQVVNAWGSWLTVIDTDTLQAVQFQPREYRRQWLTGGNTEGGAAEPPEGYVDPINYELVGLFGDVYGNHMASQGVLLYARAQIDPLTGDVICFMQGVTFRSAILRFRINAGGFMTAAGSVTLVYVRAFYTDQAVGNNWLFGSKIWMVDQHQRTTYCFDVATGAEDWRKSIRPPVPVNNYGGITSATYRVSDGVVYATWTRSTVYDGGGIGIFRQSLATGDVLNQTVDFLPRGSDLFALYDSVTDSVIIVHPNGFLRLDPVSLAVTETVVRVLPAYLNAGPQNTMMSNAGANNAVAGSIWLSNGGRWFSQVSTAPGFPLLWEDNTDNTIKPVLPGMSGPIRLASSRPAFFSQAGGTQTYRFGNEGGATTDLATIVSDICRRCDLEASDIDVTGIAGKIVPGYGVLRESTGRAAIEPLASAYGVDAPERDGKLRFQFRKTALDATVSRDDLGAQGGNEGGVRVTERRRQEIELPSAVTVTYSSRALDYQQNTQSTKRIDDTIEAGDPRSQEFPLVLDDADANTLSSRLLFLAWIERTSYSFTLPLRFLRYDPGDVIDLALEDGAVRTILTKVELGGDGVVSCEALATDDLARLPPPETVVMPIFTPSDLSTIEVMKLVAIDAPLLSDADDLLGLYVGGDGETAAWNGGTVLASANGTAYEQAATIAEATPVGVLSTALPYHASALIDRSNTLHVAFDYDPGLESISELELLAGGNRMMVGAELVGFATAAHQGGGVYALSVLLRGQQGTEWAASHQGGTRVVVLDDISSVDMPGSQLNQPTYFKAVSLGEFADDIPAQTVTMTGVRLKPLSPVHIAGVRDDSNNLSLSWVRRARVNGDWLDFSETALDEPVEAYEIDVLSGSTVLRTIASSTAAASYSAAEQIEDAIVPGASVSVKIYQLSTRVGRGYAGVATL